MRIECPHCGQHIELEGSGISDFSCPTCNGHIELQVKVEAVRPPANVNEYPGQVIKLPVLLGCIALAVVLSLLVGWKIWGGDNSAPELPLSQRMIGIWHERTDQPGAMYYKFHENGNFEWGGYRPEDGEKGYFIMLRGRFKISEDGLLQTQQFNPNTRQFDGE